MSLISYFENSETKIHHLGEKEVTEVKNVRIALDRTFPCATLIKLDRAISQYGKIRSVNPHTKPATTLQSSKKTVATAPKPIIGLKPTIVKG
ncbi:MAG: hypothetical protein QNJ31_01765 [Candidatus Caenarcaniphilales bacterium]|nr:hypothetical protein [Candidatus Caenarcaniphilales bacterium]